MILRSIITVLALAGVSVAAATASGLSAPKPEASRRVASDNFAIYTSTLAGNGQTLIASDPTREINHAHLSPDRSRLAFTRYNVFNSNGVALETTSYLQTEIVVCDANGNNCKVVIPAQPGIMAANASWTPDGSSLLYFTNVTPTDLPGISLYNLATGGITPFYQPSNIIAADPSMVGQEMVVSGRPVGGSEEMILLVDTNGMRMRVLTSPKLGNSPHTLLGDYDPKISPDGTKVALMRHLTQNNWAIVIVNIATGAETNLSPPNPVDAVPEWSSDGKLLIFWHVDPANSRLNGIYTMLPNGAQRTQVPFPIGPSYTMAAFFPGGGSLPSSGIIYSLQN